jgi:uncharacterized protein (DUF2147 family)
MNSKLERSMLSSPSLRPKATGSLVLVMAGLAMLPLTFFQFSSALAANGQVPLETGVWVDDSGAGAVEIYVCADRADRLCGRIVWLKEPLNAQGVPKRDKYNPAESMQMRPICGLPVLGNLEKVSEGGFDNGWIYDPKVGKSYSAAVQLASQDRLTVTGYVGLKFLSKTFAWTRAPADLVRCDSASSASLIKGAKPAAPAAQKPPTTAAAPEPSAPKAEAAAAPQKKEPAVQTVPAKKPVVVTAPPPSSTQANAGPTGAPAPKPAGSVAPAVTPAKPKAEAALPAAPSPKPAAAKSPPKPAIVAATPPAANAATAEGKQLPGTEQKSSVGGPKSALMPWELYGIGDEDDAKK